MDVRNRQESLIRIQKKLVVFTIISMVIILTFTYTGLKNTEGDTSYIVLLVLSCGLIGGFVSVQQRLHNISDAELVHLSASWACILLIPIYGAIFALVLHVIFVSDLINGAFFPSFVIPSFSNPPTMAEYKYFFSGVLPSSGQDIAKMLFWSFCAGFSERLVPQIVKNIEERAMEKAEKSE